jgi:hypothetical protein
VNPSGLQYYFPPSWAVLDEHNAEVHDNLWSNQISTLQAHFTWLFKTPTLAPTEFENAAMPALALLDAEVTR